MAKMSKSYDNTIEIFATDKATANDVGRLSRFHTLEDPKSATCNVFSLIKLFVALKNWLKSKQRIEQVAMVTRKSPRRANQREFAQAEALRTTAKSPDDVKTCWQKEGERPER